LYSAGEIDLFKFWRGEGEAAPRDVKVGEGEILVVLLRVLGRLLMKDLFLVE